MNVLNKYLLKEGRQYLHILVLKKAWAGGGKV